MSGHYHNSTLSRPQATSADTENGTRNNSEGTTGGKESTHIKDIGQTGSRDQHSMAEDVEAKHRLRISFPLFSFDVLAYLQRSTDKGAEGEGNSQCCGRVIGSGGISLSSTAHTSQSIVHPFFVQ